jgi:hypothetical protein
LAVLSPSAAGAARAVVRKFEVSDGAPVVTLPVDAVDAAAVAETAEVAPRLLT